MFENIIQFFKKFRKSEKEESKNTAKERLHLVLAQDRANISADFLEMMKQEIIEVIKKYIDIDEKAMDVRLTNKESEDGVMGAPSLYANIPIITIKNETRKLEGSLNNDDLSEEVSNNENENEIDENNNIEENNINDNKENEEKEETVSQENNSKPNENDVDEKGRKADIEPDKKDNKSKQKKNNKKNVVEGKNEKKDS